MKNRKFKMISNDMQLWKNFYGAPCSDGEAVKIDTYLFNESCVYDLDYTGVNSEKANHVLFRFQIPKKTI